LRLFPTVAGRRSASVTRQAAAIGRCPVVRASQSRNLDLAADRSTRVFFFVFFFIFYLVTRVESDCDAIDNIECAYSISSIYLLTQATAAHAQGAVVPHEHLVQQRQGRLTSAWQSAAECTELLAGDQGVDGREVAAHVDAAEGAWLGDVACW
jgi:hypothetical protein